MLTENLRKSEISVAYLHSIAAKCGFEFSEPRIDNDSADVLLSANGKLSIDSTLTSSKIEIQLKATVNWVIKEGKISFSLTKKNYDDLRAKTVVAKILVLLCLPKTEEEWISHSIEQLTIRKCAYWISLKDYPERDNESNVTVHLEELFSPETLKDLLLKISKEEW
jgi:hypothetical protein